MKIWPSKFNAICEAIRTRPEPRHSSTITKPDNNTPSARNSISTAPKNRDDSAGTQYDETKFSAATPPPPPSSIALSRIPTEVESVGVKFNNVIENLVATFSAELDSQLNSKTIELAKKVTALVENKIYMHFNLLSNDTQLKRLRIMHRKPTTLPERQQSRPNEYLHQTTGITSNASTDPATIPAAIQPIATLETTPLYVHFK